MFEEIVGASGALQSVLSRVSKALIDGEILCFTDDDDRSKTFCSSRILPGHGYD